MADDGLELDQEQRLRLEAIKISARYHSGITSYTNETVLLRTAEHVEMYIKHGQHTII